LSSITHFTAALKSNMSTSGQIMLLSNLMRHV